MTTPPPVLPCSRCGATAGVSDDTCGTCGLHLACATCHERFGEPSNQRFCPVCGTLVPPQPAWPRHDEGEAPAEDGPDAAAGPTASNGGIFAHQDAPAAASSLRERALRRGERVMRRTIRKRILSLAALYEQLGEELMERERFEEAIDAYQHALEEVDDPAVRRQIYASLAESTTLAAEKKPAMRPTVVRIALKAAQRAPDVLPRTVARLRHVLDADVLATDGAWISGEWWPSVEDTVSGPVEVDCEILAGRAALFNGDHVQATRLFASAREHDATAARTIAQESLDGPLVPQPLLDAAPAETRLMLANARAAVGDDERALDDLDAAIGIGFVAQATGEVEAHQLRAALLERGGRDPEAAEALVRLGTVLTEQDRYPDALVALQHAIELAPDAPGPRLQLGDTLRIASQLDDVPFVDAGIAAEGRAAVLEGIDRSAGVPGTWPYCVLALLDDSLAETADESRAWYLDGLLAAEQALAVDDRSADAWALVARMCRGLRLLENARLAADRAVGVGPESVLAVQEDLIIALDVHDPRTRERLERHRTTLAGYDAGRHTVAGYLELLDGHPAAALRELDRAERWDPFHPAIRLGRAMAGELVGDPERAGPAYAALADSLPAGAHPYRVVHAWATVLAGRPEQAMESFERMADTTGAHACERAAGLAACAYAIEDAEVLDARLREAVTAALHRGDAAMLSLYFGVLERRPAAAALRDRVAAAREEAGRLAIDLPEVRGGRHEAIGEAAASPLAREPAVLVLRARFAAEEKDWASAAELLAGVTDVGRPFPELPRLSTRALHRCGAEAQERGDVEATASVYDRLDALGAAAPWERDVALAETHRVARDRDAAIALLVEALDGGRLAPEDPDALRRAGDLLLRLGELGPAEDAFQRRLQAAPAGGADVPQLQLRLGLLAALRDDVADAHRWLVVAVDGVARSHDEHAIGSVIEDLCALVPADGRLQLDSVLRSLDRDPLLTASRKRRLTAARLQIVRSRGPRLEPVAALVISLDPRHYTGGPGSPLIQGLVKEELPKLRRRLSERTGVSIPGSTVVRHPEPLPGGEDYAILVRQVWLASGVLPPAHVLCRDAERCRALGLVGPPFSPGSGLPEGTWLDAEAAGVARQASVELLDQPAAVAWHLELTIRPYLAEFVGVSEIEFDMRRWAAVADADAADLVERTLRRRAARVDFAALVHRLVEEQVPVDQRAVLLAAFADTRDRHASPEEQLEEARRAIAPGLRRRFARATREVPLDVEREIARHVQPLGATPVLAIPRADADRLLDELDPVVTAAAESTIALVVADAAVRPFVQHLVDSRWAGVPVVSAAELELLRGGAREPVAERLPA